MELDDLKPAWAALAAPATLHFDLQRASWLVHRVFWLPVVELVTAVALTLFAGSSYEGRLDQPLFVACLISIHVGAVALIVVAVRQLALLRGLDPAGSVLDAQRRLEQVRCLRITTTKWTLILAPLAWTPLAVVGGARLGIDLALVCGWAWIAANLAFGIVAAAVLIWIARLPRVSRSRFVQRLRDDIAGRSLVAAQAYVARLTHFANG